MSACASIQESKNLLSCGHEGDEREREPGMCMHMGVGADVHVGMLEEENENLLVHGYEYEENLLV